MGDAGFAPQSILLGTPVLVQRPSQRKRKTTDTQQHRAAVEVGAVAQERAQRARLR